MRRIIVVIFAAFLFFTAHSGETVPRSYSPNADMEQTLGTLGLRWLTVYAKSISDGEGHSFWVEDLAEIASAAALKDHRALTEESRGAADSHPIGAITGLADALRPATQAYSGIMVPSDKAKLDNLAPDSIVRYTLEGNIRLPNAKKLLGASLGGQDFNLIELNQWDQVDIGSTRHQLNLNSVSRPTVQIDSESGGTAEALAFLSDIARTSSWEVETVADLLTLAEARVSDVARITTGEDAGDIYQLVAADYASMDSWLNITRDGGVIAVNGKTGAVTVDLVDFPDVQQALNERALASTLSDYAPLNSPSLSGVPTAPTAGKGTSTKQIATTEFVKNAIADISGAVVGEFRMMPFRPDELPPGWWFPSGDYFAVASPVGQVLSAFSANYKNDWGIVVSGSTIRLYDPDKFFAVDGDDATVGRFPRFVDGTSRLPGSVQDDAIRNIIGGWSSAAVNYFDTSGAVAPGYGNAGNFGANGNIGYSFDASRVVPTAAENRPFEIALTPAFYLGVPRN